MLIDKIRVDFYSGKGGNGAVKFHRNGKPSGGNGGNGGSVYLEGTRNLYDLKNLKHERVYHAKDAEPGGANSRKGSDGDDVIVKVPLTTIVYNLDNEKVITIFEHGQKELLLEGGRGGRGNYEFRGGQVRTLKKFTPGRPGQDLKAFLELRLKADVIFIGFPNAGKSSMLNALTNAESKVAAYPFTTLEPHLGVAGGLIMMDLPGLIEGTSEGKGVGTRFVKHTKGAKLIAHFISLENEDVVEKYESMREELKDIDPELANIPEIIILSKSDIYDEEYIDSQKEKLEKINKSKGGRFANIFVASAFKLDELPDLMNIIKQNVND